MAAGCVCDFDPLSSDTQCMYRQRCPRAIAESQTESRTNVCRPVSGGQELAGRNLSGGPCPISLVHQTASVCLNHSNPPCKLGAPHSHGAPLQPAERGGARPAAR